MDEYVTKSVDVKRVVSPNDSLILESANNIVLDTPVERILIDGMRIRDYVHREIFRRGGASTGVVELESSSSAAVGAKTNFDSVYSREGEFRTEETHCAALDASGSFIDVDKAHVITLEGSNELRLNANSVENIYVGNRTLREVIYNIMNEYRLENRGTYDIAHFEHVPVERSTFGRESGRMGTSHTNTLRTYKITTNYTLIDGEEPDLIIRSSAGVQIDSPNFYLNNQLFQEYIKQFLDERGFFSLQVDTSPGAEIPYTITNFSVQEHGSIFDYKVTLFMYQEDISEEDIKADIGVYQEESSVHTINLTHFPSGAGKPDHSGDFTALTPGSVYNMYADFLNLRTMTLVPKVHVRDGILTVVLKSFTISILNETSLKIVVEKYEEYLDTYGSTFKFNMLLNTDEVTDPASNSYLFKFPPHNNYDTNVPLTQNERSTAASNNLSGVFIYHSNNDQVDNNNEYSNIVYRNRANQNLSSNYVINFRQAQTFRLYTPKLNIYSPVIERSRELIELAHYNAHFSSNLRSSGGPMSNEVAFSSIGYASSNYTYTIMMNSSALQSNWPRWLDQYGDTGTRIPKFEYIKFLLYGSNSEGSYLIKSNIVVKHRADFTAGSNEDLKIEVPNSNTLIITHGIGIVGNNFSNFIRNGTGNTDFTLKYVNIYDGAGPYSTGIAFTTSNIRNTTSKSYILGSPRTYTITTNFTDNARTHIIDNIRFRTDNSFQYQSLHTGYIVINSNSNYSFDSNKTFTVQLPNILNGRVNMGFIWDIYDDLGRSYEYEQANTEDLYQPTGNVTVTFVRGTNRRINIRLTDLRDAKGSNATGGTLSNFTATANGSSRGTLQVNPSGIDNGSSRSDGYIYLSNSAKQSRLDIIGTFTDQYGFSNTNINTSFNIPLSPSASFSSNTSYVSGTIRYFTINPSSLKNAFDNNATNGSFSNFEISIGGIAVTITEPSFSNNNVIAGQFQASDTLSQQTYNISGTFIDDYGFSDTIIGDITVPGRIFPTHNIQWNKSHYRRQFILSNISNYYVSTYAWHLSGTGTGTITSGSNNSNVTLSSNISSTQTLGCSNITQSNYQGFTKTGGTATSLNLSSNHTADNTFSTYAVTHSSGRTFTLTETGPATTTIDGETNTNQIFSRVWGDEYNSTGSTVTLSEDYLIDNSNNNATLGCDVNTQNIVGFIKSRTATSIVVKGNFSNFGSGHTLSFTNITTPTFIVLINAVPYTSKDDTQFRLIYSGSEDDSNYSNIDSSNYYDYAYVKMSGRLVSDRGFQNVSNTDLATFDAVSNKPQPPPPPILSNNLSGLDVKTTSNITFSSIASNNIGSHGIPVRGGVSIQIKYSDDSNDPYPNSNEQSFGSPVTVSGLSEDTIYYFKYEKTYSSGLWTAVDPSHYLSSSYTIVSTLKTPTFSNEIFLSVWYEDQYSRLSLSSNIYNTNDGTNTNYNSDFSVKLYFSTSTDMLFNCSEVTTLSYYHTNIYKTKDLDLTENYCVNLSNYHLDSQIEIRYDVTNTNTLWKTLYIGLEIQYSNYYPSVRTSNLYIKTRTEIPHVAKINDRDLEISEFKARINYDSNIARISCTFQPDKAGYWYKFEFRGNPVQDPNKVYLVISSDSDTIKRENIRLNASNPEDILDIKGSNMYGIYDVTQLNHAYFDVELVNKSVYAGNLYISFLSIYPYHNLPGTLTYDSREQIVPDYRLGRTAIHHNYNHATTYGSATNITLVAPSNPSSITLTRDASNTTLSKLVWTFDHVEYNHGNYTVTHSKWGVSTSSEGTYNDTTTPISGTQAVHSNYEIIGLSNSTGYYVRLYVSYDNETNWKYVTSSSTISTKTPPDAPTYNVQYVDTSTLGALKFTYSNFDENPHGDYTWSSNYNITIVGSDYPINSGILTITGLSVNSNYTAKIYKIYDTTDFVNSNYSETLTVSTRNYQFYPNAPSYESKNVDTTVLETLTFYGSNFTPKSHGDFAGDFSGYYTFISNDPSKNASGTSNDILSISNLRMGIEYDVKFYKTYTNANLTQSNYSGTVTVTTGTLNFPSDPIWNESYTSDVISEITIFRRSISVVDVFSFNDFATQVPALTYYVTINNDKKTFHYGMGSDCNQTWSNLDPGSTYTLSLYMKIPYPHPYTNTYSNYISSNITYDITVNPVTTSLTQKTYSKYVLSRYLSIKRFTISTTYKTYISSINFSHLKFWGKSNEDDSYSIIKSLGSQFDNILDLKREYEISLVEYNTIWFQKFPYKKITVDYDVKYTNKNTSTHTYVKTYID